jgi:hypothetical protein
MATVQPQGEKLRKAVKYVSDMRQQNPGINLVKLIDDAALRYDLSPKDSEFLARFVKERTD